MEKAEMADGGEMEIIHGETCPVCNNKTLTLIEEHRNIPYFGQMALFSMTCKSPECGFHKSDLESLESRKPINITFDIESEEDLSVRVVKSASATVKFARIATWEATESANGYVTNIEGLLNRLKKVLEEVRDNSDDPEDVTKAKNHLKKLMRVMWGQEKMTLSIVDSTGNSAIISDKARTK